ncbi:MAG: ABC transporter permease [Gemmatimonadetes bacterium]|nr:ABC transporter permease [Gemmatimonadota bacterium]
MSITHHIQTVFANLAHYRLRSVLTLLGIAVGIGAVTAIIAIGEGLHDMVMEEFESVRGGTMVWVSPSKFTNREGRWMPVSDYEHLVWKDMLEIGRRSNAVRQLVPAATLNADLRYAKMSHGGMLYGTTPSFLDMYQWPVSTGRFIIDRDVKHWRKVCVLGDELAAKLFDDSNPIGKELKLNGQRFAVIGVMKPKTVFNESWGNRVFVPITTAQKRMLGHEGFDLLSIKVADSRVMDSVMGDIEAALKTVHGDEAVFDIVSGKDAMDQIGGVINAVKSSIAAVAGISLMVGGIGIMNMMLVSVTERRREIGIRKSVGARHVDIVNQFTLEATCISTLGGLLGISLGLGLGSVFSFILNQAWDLTFTSGTSVSNLLVSLAISLAIGLCAGIYPALKASQLSPVDAMNKE